MNSRIVQSFNDVIFLWPYRQQHCVRTEGITLFWALMLASCCSNRIATESEGMFAAKCRAVFPLMSTRLGSAWFSSSMFTHRSCWPCTAWGGDEQTHVQNKWYRLRKSSGFYAEEKQIEAWSSNITFIKADLFWLSHRLSLALLSTRNCTASTCPLAQAIWRAVL